ncbi:hypothetical protein HK105_200923 [Polyrhizophydium stewartii]|uniref:Ribosome biogenesis protein NOP53 n=1 Tax=Polyrhizophydium stewartii TaxID=2732419 RepID=A0ABR4NIB4_9FUNG|nr:hypothetical protein HK105_004750 [Polyrhizophydium stewartii]
MTLRCNKTKQYQERAHRRKAALAKRLAKVDGPSLVQAHNSQIRPLEQLVAEATERVAARKLLTAAGEPEEKPTKTKLVRSIMPGRVGKNSSVRMPTLLSKKKAKKLLQAAKLDKQRKAAAAAAAAAAATDASPKDDSADVDMA